MPQLPNATDPVYTNVDDDNVEHINGEELLRLDYAFPEAPASANFYGVTTAGWNVQFTLRDIDETNLMRRFATFTKFLIDNGVTPKQVGRQSYDDNNNKTHPAGDVAPTKTCPIHGVEMPERTAKKTGKKFYSHYVDDDGKWCYGE